jgi:hypothetical protein
MRTGRKLTDTHAGREDEEILMRRYSIAATIFFIMPICWSWPSATAQSMDDLNLQVHGYATQGFIYSTNNNWDTTDSTDGSAAWTEAVVNVTAQPQPKLRVGVQARYFLLGTYGNAITLDWAQGDYKVNEHFGFRVGKVKTPAGMLNETQDIDPAYLWILLPQSIYPIASRNTTLAHYGGVVYGTLSPGDSLGKLEYRAYGGQRVVDGDDGFLQPLRDQGVTLPNGLTGSVFGGTLRWDTPVQGLMLGATESSQIASGAILYGPYSGTLSSPRFYVPYYFGRFERNKLMVAGEYSRWATSSTIQIPGLPGNHSNEDLRSFYGMASFKLAEKLTAGLYYSSSLNRKAAFTSSRFQKDWAVSGRYDFNPFLYAKFEQHFVDGTEIGYSTSNNTGGYKPNSRMTLLKLGVSF